MAVSIRYKQCSSDLCKIPRYCNDLITVPSIQLSNFTEHAFISELRIRHIHLILCEYKANSYIGNDQTNTSSNQYIIKPIRHQAKISSNQYVIKPIRHQTNTSSNQYVIKPIRHQTKTLYSRKGLGHLFKKPKRNRSPFQEAKEILKVWMIPFCHGLKRMYIGSLCRYRNHIVFSGVSSPSA